MASPFSDVLVVFLTPKMLFVKFIVRPIYFGTRNWHLKYKWLGTTVVESP
jgi:hypothetical protein